MTPLELLFGTIMTIVTLGVMSVLWKENALFHMTANIIIGSGTAHFLLWAIEALKSTAITPISLGNYLLIIPLLIGVLQLGRLSKNYGWVSRYPVGILIGAGIGIGLAAVIRVQLINLIRSVGTNIFTATTPLSFWSYLFAGIGSICGLTYFIFTREHTGPMKYTARIGRIVLMAGFGIGWGSEVGWFLSSISTRITEVVRFILSLFGVII